MSQKRSRTERVRGLDTLRAVAVVLVVGYHLVVPGLSGGFLGVTLFFVISGYLITRLLLAEYDGSGGVDVVAFWVRRARRLLPAAYVMVLLALATVTVVAPTQLHRWRGDGLAALAYASNWWMIFHRVSYFDSWGLPSPLGHLWTLAIEEQFYLVWPLLLMLLLAVVRRRQVILGLVAAAVLASSLGMTLGFDPQGDPNRVYLGTDTRAAELLIGALLALALHLASADSAEPDPVGDALRRLQRLAPALSVLVLAGFTLALLTRSLSDYTPATYRGGIQLAALASAALVLAVQAPAFAPVVRRLDAGLAGALGRRSYSVYLWHYPLLVAFSSPVDVNRFSGVRAAVVVVLTLVCAEASYRFVETPIRRHGFRATARLLGERWLGLPVPGRHATALAACAPILLATLALSGRIDPVEPGHGPAMIVTGAAPSAAPGSPGVATQSPSSGPSEAPGRPHPIRREDFAGPLRGRDTLVVGDSLMIDIAPLLRHRLPGLTINAEIGRQPYTGLDVASSYHQFDRVGGTYILGIGTNGLIDADDLAEFVRKHRDSRILLITPRVPRPWEGGSIRAIRQAARHTHNVRVVDFHAASEGHPEYFDVDGVHLLPTGARAMVQLIFEATRH